MIKFYQEFPDFEKVATLSQQLTWSHFVEILPIQDELKRDFYAAMCMQENWSVRTLRCVKEKNPCFMNELQYRRKQKKRLKMKLRNYDRLWKNESGSFLQRSIYA